VCSVVCSGWIETVNFIRHRETFKLLIATDNTGTQPSVPSLPPYPPPPQYGLQVVEQSHNREGDRDLLPVVLDLQLELRTQQAPLFFMPAKRCSTHERTDIISWPHPAQRGGRTGQEVEPELRKLELLPPSLVVQVDLGCSDISVKFKWRGGAVRRGMWKQR